jgi:hypothetical protein
MTDRTRTTDAPPPPPPPPPPDQRSDDRAPEATPELADALARDDRGRDREPTTHDRAREQGGARPGPGPPDLPEPDASPELRSAIADSSSQDRNNEAVPAGLDTSRPGPADYRQPAQGPGDIADPDVVRAAEPRDDGRPDADPAVDEGTGTDQPPPRPEADPAADRPDRPDPDSIRITPDRATHILDGDRTGGGHRAGAGGETEFPADWDDERILNNVEDVARNPDNWPEEPQPNGRWRIEGVRDGVHITAIVNPDGSIRTAWPREGDPGVIKNP